MGKILVIKGADFSKNAVSNIGGVGEEKTVSIDFSTLELKLGGFSGTSTTWSTEGGINNRSHYFYKMDSAYSTMDIKSGNVAAVRIIFVDSTYDNNVTAVQDAQIVGCLSSVIEIPTSTERKDIVIPDGTAGIIILKQNGGAIADRTPEYCTLKKITV